MLTQLLEFCSHFGFMGYLIFSLIHVLSPSPAPTPMHYAV